MIHFVCGECGKSLKISDNPTAKKVRCPGCGHISRMLAADAASNRLIKTKSPVPADEATVPPRADREGRGLPAKDEDDFRQASDCDAGEPGKTKSDPPDEGAHTLSSGDAKPGSYNFLSPPQ